MFLCGALQSYILTQIATCSVICLVIAVTLFDFIGQHCTEDVNECRLQPNTCQNGGTCTNLLGSYVCVCVNGWSGPDCSENIDDCATASCTQGSTCIDRVASFFCICPTGKTGKTLVKNQCVEKKSQNHENVFLADETQKYKKKGRVCWKEALEFCWPGNKVKGSFYHDV